MCLAIPGRVARVWQDADAGPRADVEYPGATKDVSLLYLPEVRAGDFVLVQAGFASRRLTEAQAREVMDALAQAQAQLEAAAAGVPTGVPAGRAT